MLGDEGGVGTVLLDFQPDVFAFAGRQLQRQLVHDEVSVAELQRGAATLCLAGLPQHSSGPFPIDSNAPCT
ncbi:hypothetical protein [Ideonella sp.]|uniref:hypothetical protein n=1 Tax=Ideonella sp. TaxID=1929293 RepID=UPI003BB5D888